MQAVAGDSLIGERLAGKYRVVRQIGQGGMGVVYEAEHVGLGKRVAVKLMLEKYTNDTEAIARFHREALAAGRIGNPHIIEIFDIGTAPDGRSFVVMELLTGFPLAQVLQMSGAMQPWRAVQIMRQVLRAVGAAHAKGIIHRDLKPDNIFLINQSEDHDFVKLLDFGISKVVSLEEQVAFTKLTTTGVVMGTPLYMAPEQAMGEAIERFADIYACGVILYEMLAGKPPFDGATYAVLVAKLLTSLPPPLDELRAGLPSSLVRAVHRALEKEPSERFQSAEEFAAALPHSATPSHLELAGTLDAGVITAAQHARRPGRMSNLAIAGIAFTLAAAATAGVLVLTSRDDAQVAAPAAPPRDEPAAAPAATTGTLEVKSTPSGASVSVDDRPAGTTPIVVTLDTGRHQVRVELPEHDAITTDQDVRANERTAMVIQLVKREPAATALPDFGLPEKALPLNAGKGSRAKLGKSAEAAKPLGPAAEPPKKQPAVEPVRAAPGDEPAKKEPKPNPY